MKKAKIILWDWDNTLVDTFEAIWCAQNDMRVHYGLPEWSKEEAKKAMNKSGRNLIKDLVGEDKAKEARIYYLRSYAKNIGHLKLKESAVELLEYTHRLGYINILASNKAKNILLDEAKELGVLSQFDKIIGAEEAAEDKPSKIFTDKAMEDWKEKALIVSIGDGLSDVKMAHNYPDGISILVFTNPNGSEFESEKPDYSAANLASCKTILKDLTQGQKVITHHKNATSHDEKENTL